RAADEGCSIATIGLGAPRLERYLRGFEATGGFYLFAPGPDYLRRAFAQMEQYLQHEHVLEYDSPSRDADGSRRALRVVLNMDGRETHSESARYAAPGVIPNVQGDHLPFLLLLLGLLAAPGLLACTAGLVGVWRFRRRSLMRLEPGSPHLAK